jgi:hypothetical protein
MGTDSSSPMDTQKRPKRQTIEKSGERKSIGGNFLAAIRREENE